MPTVKKNFKLKWWIFTATQTLIILMISAQTALGEEENTNNYNHTEYILKNIEASKLDLALKDKNMQEALNIILYQDKISKLDDSVIRKYSKELKTLLPLSLYTLMTADKVCIRNVGLNEYLNTGHGKSDFYLHDERRRTAYTSAKCSQDGFGVWQLQDMQKNVYYIHSVNMNENMYASVSPYVADRHTVWIWIPDRNLDNTYEWTFEMFGHDVYIKSNKFSQYLYGSSRTEKPIEGWYRGHVYAHDGNDCQDDYCLWHFEDCTNVE